MDHGTSTGKGLPENAYKELKPGEEYRPIMDAASTPQEVTPYSVIIGLLMAVLFSAAAAYSGLKIGQVFEAAIPIAILAVGISTLVGKKNALGQNVIIQSIGSASGVIVAGAIFTIPALYILDLPASFYQVFFASAFGGFLGILFLIPFRKYFVKDMHGKLPFPEATATTEILVAGEKGGSQALVLVVSGLIGGLFDFMFSALGLWSEVITSRMIPIGEDDRGQGEDRGAVQRLRHDLRPRLHHRSALLRDHRRRLRCFPGSSWSRSSRTSPDRIGHPRGRRVRS